MIDIKELLKEHNIEVFEHGPNVKEGNINVRCPFCLDDPSHHMGINLKTGAYGCWRNKSHRGKNTEYLISKLLNVSIMQARALLGVFINTEDFSETTLAALYTRVEEKEEEKRILGGVKKLTLRKEFQYLGSPRRTNYNPNMFYSYLQERGFYNYDSVATRYNLHFAVTGRWKYRIIAPIYYKNKLATWIGRTISKVNTLPYMDLDIKESVRHAKYCLFDHPNLLEGGHRLYITEGIFDAMKLGMYLPRGNKATCLFTKTMTPEQSELIIQLSTRFEEVVVLLDNDALAQALGIRAQLGAFMKNVVVGILPTQFKDPGELPREVLRKGLVGGELCVERGV